MVCNGLISHCRKVNNQPRLLSLDQSVENGEPEPGVEDQTEEIIDYADATALLGRLKGKYSGVTKLGIEALELKIKGLDGTEIARLYGVRSNHVKKTPYRRTVFGLPPKGRTWMMPNQYLFPSSTDDQF